MVFGIFKRKEEPCEKDFLGKVVHYFPKVKAAVIRIEKGNVSAGEKLRIKGHTTDFSQKASSMEIDHKPVEKVKKKQEVAVRVKKKVRRGDRVYLMR